MKNGNGNEVAKRKAEIRECFLGLIRKNEIHERSRVRVSDSRFKLKARRRFAIARGASLTCKTKKCSAIYAYFSSTIALLFPSHVSYSVESIRRIDSLTLQFSARLHRENSSSAFSIPICLTRICWSQQFYIKHHTHFVS